MVRKRVDKPSKHSYYYLIIYFILALPFYMVLRTRLGAGGFYRAISKVFRIGKSTIQTIY